MVSNFLNILRGGGLNVFFLSGSKTFILFLVFVKLFYLGDGSSFSFSSKALTSCLSNSSTGFLGHEFPGSFELFSFKSLQIFLLFLPSIYFSFVFCPGVPIVFLQLLLSADFSYCNSSQPFDSSSLMTP